MLAARLGSHIQADREMIHSVRRQDEKHLHYVEDGAHVLERSRSSRSDSGGSGRPGGSRKGRLFDGDPKGGQWVAIASGRRGWGASTSLA